MSKLGTDHHSAKLDPDAVRSIRANEGGRTCRQLGLFYGVSAMTISKVQRFIIWSHVK